jgi:hypothetical protein
MTTRTVNVAMTHDEIVEIDDYVSSVLAILDTLSVPGRAMSPKVANAHEHFRTLHMRLDVAHAEFHEDEPIGFVPTQKGNTE